MTDDTAAVLAALASELASRCERVGDCVLWRGGCSPQGYGRINIPRRLGGKYMPAHRASWVVNRGPIPDGLYVLHKCRNKNCCSPDHLYIGTAKENARDSIRDGTKFSLYRGVTHCKRGHLFDRANTRIQTWKGQIMRQCRACERINSKRKRTKERAIRAAYFALISEKPPEEGAK